MFFPDRITNIGPGDRVLEIGPGGTPHPRADVFLERAFDDPRQAEGQRGYAPPLESAKELIFYGGGAFPFADGEFDYVICSHVLEHVEDVDFFLAELCRVARRGYLEFPTIYYEYLYDFPEHVTLLYHQDGVIRWLPKEDSGIGAFRSVTRLYYESLKAGYIELVENLKPFMCQGFEWTGVVRSRRAAAIEELVCRPEEVVVPPLDRRRRFRAAMWNVKRIIAGGKG